MNSTRSSYNFFWYIIVIARMSFLVSFVLHLADSILSEHNGLDGIWTCADRHYIFSRCLRIHCSLFKLYCPIFQDRVLPIFLWHHIWQFCLACVFFTFSVCIRFVWFCVKEDQQKMEMTNRKIKMVAD